MKQCGLEPMLWVIMGANRLQRKLIVNNKVLEFERSRRAELDAKREVLKTQPKMAYFYNYLEVSAIVRAL